MFSSTALKILGSVVLIACASSSSTSLPAKSGQSLREDNPVALDSKSMLVATLQDGQIETQWMPRDVCEYIASAVLAGDAVAGVRADGVKVYIARANCSTRRVSVSAAQTASNGQANLN